MKQTKKTKEKINDTKSQFYEKMNKLNNPLILDESDSSRKKKGPNKLEIRKEKLQLTSQKYKESLETTMNNCMPTNWRNQKKWVSSQKHVIF